VARTAYHRAYYWKTAERRREIARRLRRRARLVQYLVKLIGEAVEEARL
jgi:hypothetical protein